VVLEEKESTKLGEQLTENHIDVTIVVDLGLEVEIRKLDEKILAAGRCQLGMKKQYEDAEAYSAC